MNDETRKLSIYMLRISGISLLLLFFKQANISSLDSDNNSISILSKSKFNDDLSSSLLNYLRIKFNLFTTNQNNWPIIVSYSVQFLKDFSPAIEIERQKRILYEVLPCLFESLNDTKDDKDDNDNRGNKNDKDNRGNKNDKDKDKDDDKDNTDKDDNEEMMNNSYKLDNIKKCLTPFIDYLYNTPSPLSSINIPKVEKANVQGKCNCCVIL